MPEPAPHDLLELAGRPDDWLAADAPEWVRAALHAAPWLVVRRAPGAPGQIAVGVRGTQRHQRYATWIGSGHVAAIVAPEHLLARQGAPARRALPALQLLASLVPWFAQHGLAGGPTGSTGFELASGLAVVGPASDLDLLVRTQQPFSRSAAQRLWGSLGELAGRAGCRIDVQVEGAIGAFALADYALHERVLLRQAQGASLTADPWLASA